jgi:hypothetical protein
MDGEKYLNKIISCQCEKRQEEEKCIEFIYMCEYLGC